MNEIYDAAIIGGGPAGSTAGTVLARRGRRVIVLERERFPRFHIGESLLPFSMPALERLGVMEKVAAAGFMPKHGAEVAAGGGERDVRFYFENGFRPERTTALQVERSRFDQILLEHARECGADVREETTVREVDFGGDGVRLRVGATGTPMGDPGDDSGEGSEVRARFLLDCSGRHAVVGTRFDLKRVYPRLRKFAIYAHFDGVDTPEGIDGTLTRMVRADDCWFWLIPLTRHRTSVGVVMDTEAFRTAGVTPETMLARVIERVPVMRARMARAERVGKVHASGDYSYRSTRLHGDQWLLAGDAAGFIDPIFSSGVFLALLGGERAAEAIHVALDDPRAGAREFARYSRDLRRVMKLYLEFVEGWYRREFVETLLNPTEFFDVVPAVNAVLAGNLGSAFAIRWRLWIFRLVVAAQRFAPLSPRVDLRPAVT